MRLFWKIFLSIGLAMAVALVATVYVSFQLASEAFDQVNIQGRDAIIVEAAQALNENGEQGLRAWLREHSRQVPGVVLLVVDERGEELLNRALPWEMGRLLNIRPPRGRGPGPPNLRPVRAIPSLMAPDGAEYRLLFARVPITVFGILTGPSTRVAALTIAILVAGVTSLLLARYLSAPILRLQHASRALAAGRLEARVGSPSDRRSDEVGALARDFDAMAERIQALVTDKETLLRDVSHELRSPLARIRVALALAQRRANESAQPDLKRIEHEAQALDELVGRIMTLARLNTQQTPPRERLNLDRLVQQVVDDARFEHPEARISYSSRGAYRVMGEERGLRSAVENIVRNALAYSQSDEPVEVLLEGAGEDDVALRVRDAGPGVADDSLSRIFEPFYRADPSRDHRNGGQGIGLAITARVVEQHGGTVSARNREPHGLEVIMRLPAVG